MAYDEERQPKSQTLEFDKPDRYQPALDYVKLDREHRKRSRWSTVLAVSVVVLVASLVMLGVIGFSYLQGQAKNNRVASHADLSAIEQGFDEQRFSIDWDALRTMNPDVVAWLYVPGTAINYPVVQGEDNEYYLSHDFTHEQGWLAQFGAIFLDWRNNPDWTDQAYFIYGHHMNDGSMFADIASLADQARFDASRTVYLLSPNGNFRLKTFALIHCASDDPLVQIMFSTSQDLTSYVQDKIDRSIVFAGDVPPASDITKPFAFATCDNYSSGRYVLYAYVEQESGVAGYDVSSEAARGGAAVMRIDDLPADQADAERDASPAEALDAGEQDSDGGSETAEALGDDAQPYEETYADEAYYEDDGYEGSVSVGEYGQYAGGYYVYDEGGNLVWVPTEEEEG